MLPSQAFLDNLLKTELGCITASNLLSGLHKPQLYDDDFLWAVLVWWEAIVNFYGLRDDDIVELLRMIPLLSRGYYPPGFSPPTKPPLPDLHVACRRARISALNQHVASVRAAQTLLRCGHREDLRKLSEAGIDLGARAGTRRYSRSLKNSWKEGAFYTLRLRPGKSLTRPSQDNLSLLWFTLTAPLLARIKKVPDGEKADVARDALGLVHYNDKVTLAMVSIPSRFAETRTDTGRPTFIEAGAHRRFKSRTPDETKRPCWGRAVDLDKFYGARTGNISGLLERVCGQIPDGSHTDVVMNIRFLGAAQVPRKDFNAVNDSDFAIVLESGFHNYKQHLKGALRALCR